VIGSDEDRPGSEVLGDSYPDRTSDRIVNDDPTIFGHDDITAHDRSDIGYDGRGLRIDVVAAFARQRTRALHDNRIGLDRRGCIDARTGEDLDAEAFQFAELPLDQCRSRSAARRKTARCRIGFMDAHAVAAQRGDPCRFESGGARTHDGDVSRPRGG